MRNQFGGDCYRCGLWVPPGTGYFERSNGGWRVQHCYRTHNGGITCDVAKGLAAKKSRESTSVGEANTTTKELTDG